MMLVLHRIDTNDVQTLGRMFLLKNNHTIVKDWDTLELPDLNNQVRVSRIPEGKYIAKKHISPKFGECFWIQDVPNRSEILIHKGNYHYQILGCILIGQDLADINGDGQLDVVSSGNAIKELMTLTKDLKEIPIIIIDEV